MLLLGSLSSLQVANAITAVKLDIDLVVEVGLAVVKTTSLDDDIAGHDVEASVQAGAAVTTEEMVVYLARGASDIVLLGRAWDTSVSAWQRELVEGNTLGDGKVALSNNSIGSKGTASPLLAIDAVAESRNSSVA